MGADFVVQSGCFRAERYGSTIEILEANGSYRLSLLHKADLGALRKLLDLVENEEAGKPVLVLGERRRA
jgi:hypothetical protein